MFQNSNYINVSDVLAAWALDTEAAKIMNVSYIQSPVPTGYYGRFVVPLLGNGKYFAVFDDDVIFGSRCWAECMYLGMYRCMRMHVCMFIR